MRTGGRDGIAALQISRCNWHVDQWRLMKLGQP
jgi:hypothetical protein